MSKDKNTDVDADSPEFGRGVEAGLNSQEETTNWKAGNRLGRELSDNKNEDPSEEPINQQSDIPLFLRDRREGNRGNQQDEKDTSEE